MFPLNRTRLSGSSNPRFLQALASSTDVDVEGNDIPVEDYGLYDQPPPRKRKERDEESAPTREPPPPLGWHRSDTPSLPLYTSSTRSQEDGRNTSGRLPRNISGSNGGKGVRDGTDVRVEREEVEGELEEEEEEEEQRAEAGLGVKSSRPRSNSLASASPPLPPGFFQEFDDIESECEGCCRHANSISEDGAPCLDCCSHPPTEVCSSTPSPPSHPPVPSSSRQKTPNPFNDYRSHHITPSRLASFPPPSNLLRHDDTSTPQAPVQHCSHAPQLQQLHKKIANHDKILVHHSKQIKENRQDILNHRGVLATMQRVMFLQREVDKTMSELKLQYLGPYFLDEDFEAIRNTHLYFVRWQIVHMFRPIHIASCYRSVLPNDDDGVRH